MDENINKKQFVKQMSALDRNQRVQIATELYQLAQTRMSDERIPGSIRSHVAHVWNAVRSKGRVSSWNMWKLWVFGMKPIGDLKNWRMTGKQCYRVRPNTTQYTRPRTDQSRTRRPTIRDCNGDAVPRRWLDRFAPHVKTQADWDANSIYRNTK